jgi:hypothetical protein
VQIRHLEVNLARCNIRTRLDLRELRAMSDKWADYLISKVEYNDKETHITRVLSHPDNGDTVGDGVDLTRSIVVSRLGGGSTFATIYWGSDNKWKRGANVRVVIIDN